MNSKHTQEYCEDCDKETEDARGVTLCPFHAAAHDLLAACKELKARMLINTLQNSEDAEAVRKANAAISKAEG